jgi:hypothetical protein
MLDSRELFSQGGIEIEGKDLTYSFPCDNRAGMMW